MKSDPTDTLKEEALAAAAMMLNMMESVRPSSVPEHHVVWLALLLRAELIFKGFVHQLDGPSDASVRILLRALVDLGILVSWLALDERHVVVWGAEGPYTDLKTIEHFRDRYGLASDPQQSAALEAKKAQAEAGRALAVQLGFVKAKADPWTLLPSTWRMARAAGEATVDLYMLFFKPWSGYVHASASSLPVTAGEEHISFDEGPPPDYGYDLTLATAVLAHVTATISRKAGLGFEESCDKLRARLVDAEREYAAARVQP